MSDLSPMEELSPFQEKLINYLEDAHALEQHVKVALTSMISSAPDVPELQDPLNHHKEETEQHIKRLEERLEAYGKSPSTIKDAGMMFGATGLGMLDKLRKDNAGKVARDGYTAEHLEIASYELLERVAMRAGDEATAEVARQNRADEVAMAKKIEESWDLALDMSFEQEGLHGAPPMGDPGSMAGTQPPEPGTAQ
jgi:ferritin-like metal-binding protein YciE